MTSRIQKRLLLPNRVRRPPHEGFSWVDRRFLQDYAARLSRDAILLYFFSTARWRARNGLGRLADNAVDFLYPLVDAGKRSDGTSVVGRQGVGTGVS